VCNGTDLEEMAAACVCVCVCGFFVCVGFCLCVCGVYVCVCVCVVDLAKLALCAQGKYDFGSAVALVRCMTRICVRDDVVGSHWAFLFMCVYT
jgi:hypothetical protein